MSDLDVPFFVKKQVEVLRRTLEGEKVLIAVSGGVDSTVSAVITHRAIGDNLVCIFIDDNFMRSGEPERVEEVLSAPPLNLPIKILDERKRFMEALNGLSDAEKKRKAFREVFYQTLSEAAKREECRFLVQGTIRADVIETEGGVKTQHNVLEQIGIDPNERFGFKVIEPVDSLYKYQVREVARYLGAPTEITERQPFPGPGLSVRVVGLVTSNKLEILKKATALVEDGLKKYSPDQYYAAILSGEALKEPRALRRDVAEVLNLDAKNIEAVFLRERATGIVDGKRSYGFISALGAFDQSEMPLDLGYEAMERSRLYIQKNYPEVTRVLFLVDFADREGFLVALRAVRTKDFITAEVSELPWTALKAVSHKVLRACPMVSKVYYDVTPKPPATIEFE